MMRAAWGASRGGRGLVLLGLVALAACDREPSFSIGPDGIATVNVQAYLEYDGQRGFGGFDQPAEGLRFELVLPGSGTAVASGVADEDGVIQLEQIRTGTYDLRVDPDYLGDTLVMANIDTTRVTLSPSDVVTVQVGVTPPTRTMAEARTLPEGRRVWITGMALNSRGTSIDRAVHVLEEGFGAMRVVFPAATGGAPGDSVRVLGRTVGTGSRRYLSDGLLRVVASAVRLIRPLEVSVAEARTAGGGALDARLVIIQGGTVTDTVTIPFVGLRLTVGGAANGVHVLLPQQNGFGSPNIAPGRPVVSITGLLVPEDAPAQTWQIVPRGGGDVEFGPPPPGG
jgi:hypothetical protein